MNRVLKYVLITAGLLLAAFGISMLFYYNFGVGEHVTAIFLLAVFLVSLFTQGYLYGVVAVLASLLITNLAFTEPLFSFDFVASHNIFSAFIMFVIAILTCTVTTRLKNQQQAAKEHEMERVRSNFLRAMSHDLRTPLTTICGSCSLLADEFYNLPEERRNQLLQGVREESLWLMQMTENILAVTKIDHENVTVAKTPTVLDEVIDSVIMKFHRRYPDREVQVELPAFIVTVPMDPILIEQVLLNLLENAEHHGKNVSQIWLRAQMQLGEVTLEVADDGDGISAERLSRMFTGTFEKKKSTANDGGSHNMGVGLSICATIVKAHGGTIHAANRLGGGARFWFTLPVEEDVYEQ